MNQVSQSDPFNRYDAYCLAAIALLSISTRFFYLDYGPLAGDEWFTVFEAENRYRSFLNPLYYALVLSSFEVFGFSEWAARFPAAILGASAGPLFFIALRKHTSRFTAAFVAILTVISAWHLDYSQFSRFYSGVFLFGGLSYYFYWRAFNSTGFKWLVMAAVTNIIAVGFHLTAVLIAASMVSFSVAVLMSFRSCNIWTPNAVRVSRLVTLATIAAAVIAVPVLWRFATYWASKGQPYGYGPIGVSFQLVKYIGPVIVIASGFGLLCMLRRNTANAIFCAVAVGVPGVALVIGAGVTYVRPDYVFYSLPIWFLLSAYFCEHLRREATEKWSGLPTVAVSMLLAVAVLPETVSFYSGKLGNDYRRVIPFISENYAEGEEILDFASGQGLTYYGDKNWLVKNGLAYPYNSGARWPRYLDEYSCAANGTWIFVPMRRGELAQPLRKWLFEHASLKWRQIAKRFDYSVFGYELYYVDPCETRPISP